MTQFLRAWHGCMLHNANHCSECQSCSCHDGGLGALNAEIAVRTGGKKLGEMSSKELVAAFGNNPIHLREGMVVPS